MGAAMVEVGYQIRTDGVIIGRLIIQAPGTLEKVSHEREHRKRYRCLF